MTQSEEFKDGQMQGKLMAELEALKEGQREIVKSLDGLKERSGERIGRAEKNIDKIDGKMEVVLTVGKWIFAPVFSVMGLGVIAIIGWYLTRKP